MVLSVREEWATERERLTSAREEWESKVRSVETLVQPLRYSMLD
jgi:hypothetical protein